VDTVRRRLVLHFAHGRRRPSVVATASDQLLSYRVLVLSLLVLLLLHGHDEVVNLLHADLLLVLSTTGVTIHVRRVIYNLGLVVLQLVETPPVALPMLTIHHALLAMSHLLVALAALRPIRGVLSARLAWGGACHRGTSHGLALVLQPIDLVDDALLPTHRRFVLPRRIIGRPQRLFRTIIRIVAFLVAMKAHHALVHLHVFRIQTQNLVNFFLRLGLLLAVGRLVAELAAAVANETQVLLRLPVARVHSSTNQ